MQRGQKKQGPSSGSVISTDRNDSVASYCVKYQSEREESKL